jgi:Fe(3+) dicitrate transport protein
LALLPLHLAWPQPPPPQRYSALWHKGQSAAGRGVAVEIAKSVLTVPLLRLNRIFMMMRMTCKSGLLATVALSAWSAAGLALAQSPVANANAETGVAINAPIVVIGERDDLREIPGSGTIIDDEDLERSRVFTVNEALRQVPGLTVRDEEGLGLRPNIGIRGLNPTRSTEVVLLEDGLPLTYGLYGDNASYSHPPLRRFSRIEVLKGASQIRFGPHTVGGVVNYITPRAPEELSGRGTLAGGSEGYREVDLSIGGPLLGFRVLAHGNITAFDGVRENHGFEFSDFYMKAERELGPGQELILRAGLYEEDSQVSYSGLTTSEYSTNPRGNPFLNDSFVTERVTASATHIWEISEQWELVTSGYTIWFDRDWWRQSSNSGQRPADASDPTCGGIANLNTTCGNEGRLREYNVYGLESRLSWAGALFGVDTDLEFGARYQSERQNRLQLNGDTPNARAAGTSVNAGVRENNLRYADAWSGFVAANFDFGALTLNPGVRIESIEYERHNRLTGARGQTDLTEVIPGLGFTYAVSDSLSVYGGVYRGFSPPGVADIVTDAGGSVDLDPEESVNYELGIRGDLRPGLYLDAAYFVMDFENQIVPASVAGGVGATLTSAGATRHEGLEFSLNGSLQDMQLMDANDVYFRTALTWLAEASYEGRRFSNVSGFGSTLVTGNRLPYAPEWQFTGAVGYAWGNELTAQVEYVYVGEQFADDLNTVAPVANGQRGLIEDQQTWNASLNYTPGGGDITLYATVKNIADETFIVDRSRGILPNAPRLIQVGVSARF